MSISSIKTQVKVILDTLVTDSVLAGATNTDIRKDPLSADIAVYPHAFLMPPSIESEAVDNRTVDRTYVFDIMVLFQAEDIAGTDDLEVKVEAMLDKFDNNPTCNGTALGGMSPAASAPEPFQHGGRDLIMVVLQIKAKDLVTLTF
jgi:hypothetical protein